MIVYFPFPSLLSMPIPTPHSVTHVPIDLFCGGVSLVFRNALPIKWHDWYEPYYIASTRLIQQYGFDTRFIGYGFDKHEHHLRLWAGGEAHFLLPEVFTFTDTIKPERVQSHQHGLSSESSGIEIAKQVWMQVKPVGFCHRRLLWYFVNISPTGRGMFSGCPRSQMPLSYREMQCCLQLIVDSSIFVFHFALHIRISLEEFSNNFGTLSSTRQAPQF